MNANFLQQNLVRKLAETFQLQRENAASTAQHSTPSQRAGTSALAASNGKEDAIQLKPSRRHSIIEKNRINWSDQNAQLSAKNRRMSCM